MNIEILLLGKTKDSFLAEGIEEYRKRLSHYTSVSLKTIKCKKMQGSDESIKEQALALIETEEDTKYRKKYAKVWK